eukprot:TRINITY_DN58177_c0_g1_i1.p1 TRINITY_DN58177_c0_g1~~TRINITY_DN58177_c0_g1_i1.p1  ORF type:complete len:460 (-),score=87.01 TRINITY_DN58177_c0_g1_i1:57-1436(-)
MKCSSPDEEVPLLPARPGSDKGTRWRVAAACAGFLADAYDLFTIDLVVLILHQQYGEVIGAHEKSIMVSMMLAGVIIGQLSFGYIADWVGRKWAFVATAALTIIGALACSFCGGLGGPSGLPVQLALCRFMLGIGVGGEYPLSATVSAEAASDPVSRGQLMGLVLSMQGFGMLLSSLIAIGALSLNMSLEATWRLLLAFGALPSAVAFGLRWSLHESQVFEKVKASRDAMGSSQSRRVAAALARHWRLLVGTASTWCFLNMFQYSLGSFKSSIFDARIQQQGLSVRAEVFQHASFSAVTSCFAILGFISGFLLVGRTSRWAMQFWGFASLAGLFFVIASIHAGSSKPSATLQLAFMGLTFFLINSGANLTTYIVPAEAFPTHVRATCHGISAASGKFGAFLGTATFPMVKGSLGMAAVYAACGVAAVLGALSTHFFTPRLAVDLEDLDEPDAAPSSKEA